jgi:hypothetical protein
MLVSYVDSHEYPVWMSRMIAHISVEESDTITVQYLRSVRIWHFMGFEILTAMKVRTVIF